MDILAILVLLVAFFPFLLMLCASIKIKQDFNKLRGTDTNTDLDLTKST